MKKLFIFLFVASAAVACNDTGTGSDNAADSTPAALTDTLPPVVVDTTIQADTSTRQ